MISADQAIGWYVLAFNGRPIVGHSGSGGGFGATALYDPATQTGVVLLANAENLWEDIACHILRPEPAARNAEDWRRHRRRRARRPHRPLCRCYRRRVARHARTHRPRPPPSAGLSRTAHPRVETHFTVQGFPTLNIDFQRDAGSKTIALTWTFNGAPTEAKRMD